MVSWRRREEKERDAETCFPPFFFLLARTTTNNKRLPCTVTAGQSVGNASEASTHNARCTMQHDESDLELCVSPEIFMKRSEGSEGLERSGKIREGCCVVPLVGWNLELPRSPVEV